VLTALLDNAQEALLGGGSVSVSARAVDLDEAACRELYGAAQPGPHVEIVIADTGTGLSPEAQRRLFAEPFFTTKPRRRGFGLAVTYGILSAHRGGLRLYPGEERGVVARVVVPAAPAASPATGEEVVRPSERLPGERILVVDDDAEVLHFVRAVLERAGYRVAAAGSGDAALEAYGAAGSDPFRLVLSDVVMPGLNGVELARKLLRKDSQVRVLFMSGHVSGDLAQPDLVGRAFELLSKPFRTEQLLRAVQNNLEQGSRLRAPAVATKK
jgi:CheY-like chemotaxis protein